MNAQTYWDDAEIIEFDAPRIQSDNLLQLANHYGSDKGDNYGCRHNYTRYYQRHFRTLRNRHLKVLEIGIARGSSLKTWASYFTNAVIDGIDINPNCQALCRDFDNVNVLVGDAATHDFGNRIYDIVIDDGSHIASDIVRTWDNMRDFVHDETIYVIEDLHAASDRVYLQAFHKQRSPQTDLATWLQENGGERLCQFLLDISASHEITSYEDKIVFIAKRGASGAIGDQLTFSFGENWLDFLQTVDNDTIASAVADIQDWIAEDHLKAANVIDIGSGSGLSSLAFRKAGCGNLLSIDVDPNSVQATKKTAESHSHETASWDVRHASILDQEFVKSLPQFDIVYSWGVLHHTGQMWKAVENAASLCRPGGLFWISIYAGGYRYANDLTLKQDYNSADEAGKKAMINDAIAREKSRLRNSGQDPEQWNQTKPRGMNVHYDIIDWLGGLPYEVARVSEMLMFMELRRFLPLRVLEFGQGACSIYLFEKCDKDVDRDDRDHQFTYNATWSEFTTRRTLMEQIHHEFAEADQLFLETRDRLSTEASNALAEAIEAQGRLSSGRHLLKGLLQLAKRKLAGRQDSQLA